MLLPPRIATARHAIPCAERVKATATASTSPPKRWRQRRRCRPPGSSSCACARPSLPSSSITSAPWCAPSSPDLRASPRLPSLRACDGSHAD
eukprot:scaffold2261_cov405-Prasinococcus_capsulatus_cf.AAC.30